MADVVEEEMSRQAARPRPQLVVDAFYEGLHPGSQAGKLRASFNSYASVCVDGSVDDVTLKMLKEHYDSAFEAELREAFPDADIRIEDLAGDGDHYRARIVSSAFSGLPRVRRHQLVYAALKGKVGGELHALALETLAPDQAG